MPARPRAQGLIAASADEGVDCSQLAGWDAPGHSPPALLRTRIVNLHEPLIGPRACFWMTSYEPTGTLVAIGWRDALRVVSELVDLRRTSDRVVEPGVLLMEEADWYRQLAGRTGQPSFHAGQSRTWVDLLVSNGAPTPREHKENPTNHWLSQVLAPPAAKRTSDAERAKDGVGSHEVLSGLADDSAGRSLTKLSVAHPGQGSSRCARPRLAALLGLQMLLEAQGDVESAPRFRSQG